MYTINTSHLVLIGGVLVNRNVTIKNISLSHSLFYKPTLLTNEWCMDSGQTRFSATSKVTVVEFWPSVRWEVTNVGPFDCELWSPELKLRSSSCWFWPQVFRSLPTSLAVHNVCVQVLSQQVTPLLLIDYVDWLLGYLFSTDTLFVDKRSQSVYLTSGQMCGTCEALCSMCAWRSSSSTHILLIFHRLFHFKPLRDCRQ